MLKPDRNWKFCFAEISRVPAKTRSYQLFKKQLLDDYKLSIIQCFYTVVHWCSNPEDLKNMKWVWYPQLEKGMAAYFDLDCHDILND